MGERAGRWQRKVAIGARRAGVCLGSLAGFALLLAVAGAALVVDVRAAPRRSSAPTFPDQPKPQTKPSEEYEAPFPTKMTWNLSEVNGKSPPAEATLMIDENFRGTGTSGCNTWSAALYPQKGHRLAMGPVAQTKRSCPTDVMNAEKLFLGILHSGPSWDQVGYTLTVKSGGGTLVFRRGL